MHRLQKIFSLVLAIFLLFSGATALAEESKALFAQAAVELLSPLAQALQTGTYTLRTGETAYVPSVSPEITPYDERESVGLPAVNGTFEVSDPDVITVDAQGLMRVVAPGTATITYHGTAGDEQYTVTVSDTALPESVKAFVYVAQREYYQTARARLPKYNQYTKWYYGKKKEVGWCAVFTIWCANASGNNPIDETEAPNVADGATVYFREGQVGNQYDAFQSLGRFVGIPRPGYLVIYGEMNNGYRTTHIGIVVDVQDRGAGVYQVSTVEGNMSNTVKSYTYLYDSNKDNHAVGVEAGLKLQKNMSVLPEEEQTDPLTQYKLHTTHWCVFGFCASWQ